MSRACCCLAQRVSLLGGSQGSPRATPIDSVSFGALGSPAAAEKERQKTRGADAVERAWRGAHLRARGWRLARLRRAAGRVHSCAARLVHTARGASAMGALRMVLHVVRLGPWGVVPLTPSSRHSAGGCPPLGGLESERAGSHRTPQPRGQSPKASSRIGCEAQGASLLGGGSSDSRGRCLWGPSRTGKGDAGVLSTAVSRQGGSARALGVRRWMGATSRRTWCSRGARPGRT